MQQSEVIDRVYRILHTELDIDNDKQIQLNSHIMNDLGADSLGGVQIIMSMEEEFSPEDGDQIEISDDDAEKIRTVKDAVDFLLNAGIQDE